MSLWYRLFNYRKWNMFEIMLGGSKSKTGGAGMFVGEVSSAEFITGDQLASAIGLTAGVSQHSNTGWLLFKDTVDGKTKYISKKPLRHTVSWDQLNTVGAVFGSKTVVINGDMYKVRLLSGANSNPATGSSGWDAPYTHGCEWNRLMYHISAKPFKAGTSNTLASEGIAEGDWASYAEADIGMALGYLSGVAGYGSISWCQETGTDNTTRVSRGRFGVSLSGQDVSSGAFSSHGWRVCLELVS